MVSHFMKYDRGTDRLVSYYSIDYMLYMKTFQTTVIQETMH